MSFRWPEGRRSAALLTFDIDGVVGFEGSAIGSLENRPAVRSLVDYEPQVAIPRILRWLDEFGIPATFFIPGELAQLQPEMVKEILRAGHEVGHHGHRHLKPDRISWKAELEEVDLGLPVLQDVTGGSVVGSRVPGWAPSAHSLDLLKQRGIRYDSSLMGHDEPYRTPEGLLEIPAFWALDDWEQWGYLPFPGWEYPMADPAAVSRLWDTHFQGIHEEGGAFVLTLHPWISGRPGYSRVIRQLLQEWHRTPGVWWPRCRDVLAHAEATGQ